MARRRSRSAYTIYRQRGGGGWILTSMGDRHKISNGHMFEIVLYRIGNGTENVHTIEVRNTRHHHGVDRALSRRCGAILGPYEGSRPDGSLPYEDQPRAVRMQRHGYDIYEALGHVRGLSETLAVKAAETFGSKWHTKDEPSDWERVQGIGSGRAGRLADAVERR